MAVANRGRAVKLVSTRISTQGVANHVVNHVRDAPMELVNVYNARSPLKRSTEEIATALVTKAAEVAVVAQRSAYSAQEDSSCQPGQINVRIAALAAQAVMMGMGTATDVRILL